MHHPAFERRRLSCSIAGSIVGACGPGPMPRNVVQQCFDDMRLDPEFVVQVRAEGPAQIVQREVCEADLALQPSSSLAPPRIAGMREFAEDVATALPAPIIGPPG